MYEGREWWVERMGCKGMDLVNIVDGEVDKGWDKGRSLAWVWKVVVFW